MNIFLSECNYIVLAMHIAFINARFICTLQFIHTICNGNVLLNKNANSSEIIVKNVIFFVRILILNPRKGVVNNSFYMRKT